MPGAWFPPIPIIPAFCSQLPPSFIRGSHLDSAQDANKILIIPITNNIRFIFRGFKRGAAHLTALLVIEIDGLVTEGESNKNNKKYP